MGQGSKERRASGKVLEDTERQRWEDTKKKSLEDTKRKSLEDTKRRVLEDTIRRGLEDKKRRDLEDKKRRGRSRERCDLKKKTGSERLTSTTRDDSKDFAETEGSSHQDQPSRENLVALIEHNHVFDEVTTRRELHFLIRSLIRSLTNIEKVSVALTGTLT